MHQLTIDDTGTVTVTDHDGPDEARRALHDYVVTSDYYLRPVQTTAGHTSYELLALDEDRSPGHGPGEPRIAGTATIEPLSDAATPAAAPYFTACEAQRWIGVAERARQRRDRDNPYPAAVLTLARGAAHGHIGNGSLISESAQLAGAPGDSHPDEETLEALRHNAITAAGATTTPAAIAAAVQQHLQAGTSESVTTTLVWYYALILWGAGT